MPRYENIPIDFPSTRISMLETVVFAHNLRTCPVLPGRKPVHAESSVYHLHLECRSKLQLRPGHHVSARLWPLQPYSASQLSEPLPLFP